MRRNEEAIERSVEMQHMSQEERRSFDTNLENQQADSVIEERLGGIDPRRLLDDEEPPRG